MKIFLITVSLLLFFSATTAFAAVGCTLADPDRDVKRLFPESTGYKTEFISIAEQGGKALASEIEEKLGDELDPIYESLDVPYAYYTILKGKEAIGRIHGVNQKGLYGGIQLILATDLEGRIISFYYQRFSSPEAAKFRALSFTGQFKGLTLSDFYEQNVVIEDPTGENHNDFKATLRGIKKNLILLDEFMLDKMYDKYYNEKRSDK